MTTTCYFIIGMSDDTNQMSLTTLC